MKVMDNIKSSDQISKECRMMDGMDCIMETMIEVGYMLGCAGKYPQAESCFRSVLALNPEWIGGWLGLGNVLLMSGRTEECEDAYEMVLESNPSDPAARAFLGELYLCTHRILAGQEILHSVYTDFPDSVAGQWALNLLQLSREVA
ncbi:tetratricopeptide repeat protein [bacterium]|nr:tetratricopeptide repeat protein [candidate division CSSED10-310 bacterium]